MVDILFELIDFVYNLSVRLPLLLLLDKIYISLNLSNAILQTNDNVVISRRMELNHEILRVREVSLGSLIQVNVSEDKGVKSISVLGREIRKRLSPSSSNTYYLFVLSPDFIEGDQLLLSLVWNF
jgi:hypothetical protein